MQLIGTTRQTYSAPFEVVPYTDEPLFHHWLTLHPPRIQILLFNVPPIAHTNIFAQLPKREANDTEQPSPLFTHRHYFGTEVQTVNLELLGKR